ncbi:MAG TPA: hypothetical protein VNI77_05255 [Nitrososphaera sp.]|nr:hypothetical protein [Nitrososphaera sp.]
MLKIVYTAGTDMDRKKERIYQKFRWIGWGESDKTIRIKAFMCA